MFEWPLFLGAWLAGLSGGVHCVGMCGGIVTALSFAAPAQPQTRWFLHGAYNLGRLTTYTVLGALAGAAGQGLAATVWLHQAQRSLELLAALFLVALGLYLGRWWQGLRYLEQGGVWLWRRIQPLGRAWLPIRNGRTAFGIGLLWGFLPCGLVYSMLIWSLSAGSAWAGGLLMLSFGLGTLPTLLALGAFGMQLASWAQRPWARRAAGLLVIGLGVWVWVRGLG